MASLESRLRGLEARYAIPDTDDPRLAWTFWKDPRSIITLAVVDYCEVHHVLFAPVGGPSNAPGFDVLSAAAQSLLLNLWALWGTTRRFARIIASLVDYEQECIAPLWWIEAQIQRATMRRRFPRLLALFAERGDPVYTSCVTYRAENWPERGSWTEEERSYLGRRYFHWAQRADADTRRFWYRRANGSISRGTREEIAAERRRASV